jgi:hypothetical protein
MSSDHSRNFSPHQAEDDDDGDKSGPAAAL